MWAKHAAAFMAEYKVHNLDFSDGTVIISRAKQQEFNSRRGEKERGSESKVVTVLLRQATILHAYRASLLHSGQQLVTTTTTMTTIAIVSFVVIVATVYPHFIKQ
jgi:hypothetical protein